MEKVVPGIILVRPLLVLSQIQLSFPHGYPMDHVVYDPVALSNWRKRILSPSEFNPGETGTGAA